VYDARFVALSGSDVTGVTDRSGHGNALTITTGTSPAYNAADAGFNDEPTIQADGGTEWMACAAFDMGASVSELAMLFVAEVDGGSANDRFCSYGSVALLRWVTGPDPQMLISGTGGGNAQTTTPMTGPHLIGGDWVSGGNIRSIINGAVEGTTANTRAAAADDSTLALFAATDGAASAAASVAYAVVLNVATPAGYLADLHAYCQWRFGVA
jgi:hypothetical protein